MNYKEALAYIHGIPRFAKTNTLERIRNILSALGNPQENLRFIHVAGTNGKGSTVTMLSAILHAAGYRVGTFVSPFVYEFLERIQLNCKSVSKEVFANACTRVREISEMMTEPPNFFEILTAVALLIYKDTECDYVVLEVGLGGTWDATNVIPSPILAIICSIALDHTGILGNTLEEIASEKCGIIKYGCHVITGSLHPSGVRTVIEDAVLRRNAKLTFADAPPLVVSECIDNTQFIYQNHKQMLPLPGRYQLENVAVVLKAAEILGIAYAAIKEGLRKVYFPARMEILSHAPLTIVDGAHNPAGMIALKESIAKLLSGRHITVIFGCLKDKGYIDMVKCARSISDTLILTKPNSPRAAEGSELLPYAKDAYVCDNFINALMLAKSKNPDVILICGSLYLAGETQSARTIIETERLILREMNRTDFHDLSEILQNKDVMYAYEHAFSNEEVILWFENQRRRYREDGFGLWAVILKDTGEMIGQCGLTVQNCDGCNVIEIGYLFKKKYWHHGYATEAAIASKKYAFKVLDENEVYSIIRDINTASQNVAIRNGMTKIKQYTKHYYNIDMPHFVYRVKRKP